MQRIKPKSNLNMETRVRTHSQKRIQQEQRDEVESSEDLAVKKSSEKGFEKEECCESCCGSLEVESDIQA